MSSTGEVQAAPPSSYENSIKRFLILVVPCFLISQGLSYAVTFPSVKDGRLQTLAAFCILLQWVVFFMHASGLLFGNERTERYYDLTGSLTFLSASAWSSFFDIRGKRSVRQTILTLLVQIWAVRLGTFLFTRINQHGGIDSRFTAIKPSLLRFFGAWTLQGVWVFLTACPVFALNQAVDKKPLNVIDTIGVALWVAGFVFEVLADYQKTAFRADAKNKDKFIASGVWSLSRHPNYAGEIALWTGIALSATNGMTFLSIPFLSCWVSPLFVSALLIFVSGIPMLEKSSDERFGEMKAYQKYKANTPTLWPFVGRRGSAPF